MSQAQAALEHHDYDRAQTLLQQARAQYDRLSTAQAPAELIAAYDELAQAGVQAAADLDRARASCRCAGPTTRWPAPPPSPRARGTRTWAMTTDGSARRQRCLQALDSRQRRLVLLFGGLALLSAAWLTLWLWARGGTQLDWGR